MADMNYDDYSTAAALMQLAQAQQAMATRPQKTFVSTTTTSTPRALEDMIMRRNAIGTNNQRLLDALKGRETFGYNFGSGLANLTPRQGYGSWLSDFARSFGGAMTRPTDAEIAREQAAKEMAQKDLETAMAIDKAMGETQTQEQTTEYKDLPYAGGKTSQGVGGELDTGDDLSGGVVSTGGVSKDYDPVLALTQSPESFGPLARLEDQLDKLGFIGKAINATGVTKALKNEDTRIKRSALEDDIARLNAEKTLRLVKGAGSVRIADSDEEKKELYGPLKEALATKDDKEIAAVFAATRRRAYSLYLQKAQKQVESGEMKSQDVASQDEFDSWWNSHWINPADIKQAMAGGANAQPAPKKSAPAQRAQVNQGPMGAMMQSIGAPQVSRNKNAPVVGQVRNGIRFLGYNPDGSMKFERVK